MSPEQRQSDDPGVTPDAGVALARLMRTPIAQFAGEFWGRQALLTRSAGDYGDLFSATAVDELISRRGLRTPFLRLAKNGATLPDSSFTAPAGVGATITDQLDDTAVWRHFAAGATMVLQALHRTWAPIGEFTAQLAGELGHPVQANAYVTPPENRGFDDHYDVHDVFVLQVTGSKRWVIHRPVHPDPLRDQPWTDHRAAVEAAAREDPAIDTVLRPGDCLYLPRGWLHAATAQGELSIHLTLGVHVWTRYAVAEHLVQDALARLREDPAARESLPLGADGPAAVAALVRKQLMIALDESDPAPAFRRARRGQERPAALGPLAQRAALDQLTADSVVRLRGGLAPWWDGRRLHTRVGWLDFEDEQLPVIQELVEGRPRSAGQLGRDLTRRLLRAGIAVLAER